MALETGAPPPLRSSGVKGTKSARGLRAAGVGVAALVAILFLWLMAWGLSSKVPVTGMSGFTRVGGAAPDFTLPLFDGGEIAMSGISGRPVVINFWNPFCAPCREEARPLERTWRTYKDSGVMFIGIDSPVITDSQEEAMAYIREFGVTYPNGRDADGKITIDYGVIGLPVTFFVGADGIVERRWVGAISESKLVAWVDELATAAHLSADAEGQSLE